MYEIDVNWTALEYFLFFRTANWNLSKADRNMKMALFWVVAQRNPVTFMLVAAT
jgi:hypothetical protein